MHSYLGEKGSEVMKEIHWFLFILSDIFNTKYWLLQIFRKKEGEEKTDRINDKIKKGGRAAGNLY